ncbi:MAG: bifunctional riboflavin kinase/FAD synthetase [Nitrospinae bacterium]|nr:bifunctional riboflavin kinase/FAD synthetase [Nitrospinota bacterium]
MVKIKDIHDLKSLKYQNSVLTIGNFDGVHSGHQQIISEVIRNATLLNCSPILLTFSPHPLYFFQKDKSNFLLTNESLKTVLIKELGIHTIITVPFNEKLANIHPDVFIEEYITTPFNPKKIIIGHDFRFGKGRKGTAGILKEKEHNYGFSVEIIDEITMGALRISSSNIRKFIQEGKMEEANKMLGYDFILSGEVIKGDGIGKTINYPTANLKVTNDLLPAQGVYAGYGKINKVKKTALINIGSRPTIKDTDTISVEIHFLDTPPETSLYGQTVEVRVLKKIREEKKFKNVEELKEQIKKDEETAKKLLLNLRK